MPLHDSSTEDHDIATPETPARTDPEAAAPHRPRVLIAYASKRGGTAGLAAMIGDALAAAGCDVEVVPAAGVAHIEPVDGVIVAGSIYAGRWHRDARRFIRRHAAELRQTLVWLVSSGPLDESADTGQLQTAWRLAWAARRINAVGTVTFGGRLMPDAKGLIAGSMAKNRAGDWRNPVQIQRFSAMVGRELRDAREAKLRSQRAARHGVEP